MSLPTERDIQIARIWIHPFKSASPIEVTKVLVESRGLQYDRIYMLVEEEKKEPGQYKSMSQKRYPMVRGLREFPLALKRGHPHSSSCKENGCARFMTDFGHSTLDGFVETDDR